MDFYFFDLVHLYVYFATPYQPYTFHAPNILFSSGTSTIANLLKSIYGWVSTKRGNFADGFHVYAFEWTGGWMRFYTDDRLQVSFLFVPVSPVLLYPAVSLFFAAFCYLAVPVPVAN
jgi:hypothetical protein